jgi:hypothetical protein
VAACLLAVGCGSPYARVPVYEDPNLSVILRATLRDGAQEDKGYRHPSAISGIRLAHILSRIDIRLGDDVAGERKPAIHTDLVYSLGERLSEALAKADPTQEVVIQAVRKEKKLGLFTQAYHTSLVAFVDPEDFLQIHLFRVDQVLRKGDEDDVREPMHGQRNMRFRVVATDRVEPIAPQAVAVDWRDPHFRKASNIQIGAFGQVRRRTVLMESEAPAEEEEREELVLPTDPETLRALAELEEERRAGELTEGEYQRRHRELLRPR